MIYLIGGPPRCGKTLVAKKLSQELSVSWVSTDTLESVIFGYVPADEQEDKFPKAVMRKQTNNSNDEMYDKYSAEEIVTAYKKQAETVSKAVDLFVETIIKDEDNFILEGHHLSVKLMNEQVNKHPQQVKAVVLYRLDEETIIKSAKEFAGPINDWFTQKTSDERTFPKIAAMIKLYGEYFEQEATKFNIPAHNVDDNFDAATEEAITKLKEGS